MKSLYFVTVACSLVTGTSSLKAQANVNLERLTEKNSPKTSLKFIESIEIQPGGVSASVPVSSGEMKTAEPAFTKITTTNATGNKNNIEQCSPLTINNTSNNTSLSERDIEYITNPALYNFINDWWATRYRYGGTGRQGIDCSAFTGKLLQEVYGITIPRTAKEQFGLSEKLAVEDLYEGDLVFFNTRGGVSHVGIYVGNDHFVHSSVHGGVTISRLSDPYYSQRFISGGRIL